MNIRILKSAERDLEKGVRFYEAKEPGLGVYFLGSLESEIESLAQLAGVHAKQRGYFRMVASRFPFSVYYKVKGNMATVHAVMDCRSNPDYIRRRLS